MPFDFKKSIENSTCRKEAAACRSATNELHCPCAHWRPEGTAVHISRPSAYCIAVAYTLKMSYKTDYQNRRLALNMLFRRWKVSGGRIMWTV